MKEFLINTFQITLEEARIFSSCFEMKGYSKSEKFIEYGKIPNKVGYVQKGCLKCVLVGDGREVIDDFVFENQFFQIIIAF